VRVKTAIRKRLRGLRKTTPLTACAERSSRIVENLDTLAALRGAKAVALFWPMEERHEVDLRPLDASLRARGVRVAYPAVLSTGEMVFDWVDDVSSMRLHPLGFLEPSTNELEEPLPVPRALLDGQRIGYGGGNYDRVLPTYARATTIGGQHPRTSRACGSSSEQRFEAV
jgi:5-formyltetrahydrofolate cyclo-ligase